MLMISQREIRRNEVSVTFTLCSAWFLFFRQSILKHRKPTYLVSLFCFLIYCFGTQCINPSANSMSEAKKLIGADNYTNSSFEPCQIFFKRD